MHALHCRPNLTRSRHALAAAFVLSLLLLACGCGGGSLKPGEATAPLQETGSTPPTPTNPTGANLPVTPAPGESAAPPAAPAAAPTPATASAKPAPAPEAPKSALPTPPGDATVIHHIEDHDGWKSCTNCAGGETNSTDYWTAGFRDSPSLDGSSREFFVGGRPWTAALFYKPLQDWSGQHSHATHFLWDFWIYVDGASMDRVWDLEFDLFQAVNGYEYMIGTHCVFGNTWEGRHWEVYSQADREWKKTSVRCSRELMPPGKWHHIQWYLRRVPDSTKYRYETLVVNGRAYQLGITQWAGRTDWQDTLGVQWQIDTDNVSGGAHEWLDKATLTIW